MPKHKDGRRTLYEKEFCKQKLKLEDREYELLAGDPFFKFITIGSFIYFDIEYRIVAVNSFSFKELEPDIEKFEKQRETKKQLVYKLYCGRHSPLPSGTVRPLSQYELWEKTSVKAIENLYGFTHFSWIKPSEFLGDHVFPKNGGFAVRGLPSHPRNQPVFNSVTTTHGDDFRSHDSI